MTLRISLQNKWWSTSINFCGKMGGIWNRERSRWSEFRTSHRSDVRFSLLALLTLSLEFLIECNTNFSLLTVHLCSKFTLQLNCDFNDTYEYEYTADKNTSRTPVWPEVQHETWSMNMSNHSCSKQNDPHSSSTFMNGICYLLRKYDFELSVCNTG